MLTFLTYLNLIKSTTKRYVLVKGTNLFIFANENAPTPAYAVELPHKRIALNDKHGNTQTVTIETNLGDVEYEVKFDLRENAAVAKNFAMALKEEVAVGNTNEIKKVSPFHRILMVLLARSGFNCTNKFDDAFLIWYTMMTFAVPIHVLPVPIHVLRTHYTLHSIKYAI